MNSSPRSNGERGLYLILIAFFLFVLVALCALVIGLGFLSTNKTRMQNIANAASIGALDSFVQSRNAAGTPSPYETRRTEAITRANEIIQANRRLPGVRLDLGDVGAAPNGGNGGTLTLGMWYSERPASGNPCGSSATNYPCFVANPPGASGTASANAIKLEIKTQSNNPLILPFAWVMGNAGVEASTSSIARLVQRCVVFLLDVSISTVQETHISTDYRKDSLPPPCVPVELGGNCTAAQQNAMYPTPAIAAETPNPVSMFAYLTNNLGGLKYLTPTPAPPNPNPCQNLNNYGPDEFFYFCNMPPLRNGTPAASSSDPLHFRSDYRLMDSKWGRVAVDSYYQSMSGYFGPQPLSRFFLAFNAGIRAVQQVRSPGDKAMIYVFQGDVIGSEPAATPPSFTMAEDMNMMVQLTNILNRGAVDARGTPIANIPVVTPNFITQGWFPYAASFVDTIGSTSNQAKALWDAIQVLSQCPDSARRVIVLASDGVPSCRVSRGLTQATISPNPAVDCQIPAGYTDFYVNYLDARQAILGPIKDELVKRGISVTTLLDSAAIEPNFLNVTVAPGTPTPSSQWINPDDAAKYGFCGTGEGGCPAFFNSSPSVGPSTAYDTWRNAVLPGGGVNCLQGAINDPARDCSEGHFAFQFSNVPQLGVKFRDPNALWGQLAIDTGGVICPLFDTCNPAWYAVATPPALLAGVRQGLSQINCAPLNQSKAQQAINCVLASVGIDPYQNVEEIPTVPAN